MGKTPNDEAYERGRNDGLNGDFLDDLAMGFHDVLPDFDSTAGSYRGGYRDGALHRQEYKDSQAQKSNQNSSNDEVDFFKSIFRENSLVSDKSHTRSSSDSSGSYGDYIESTPLLDERFKQGILKFIGVGAIIASLFLGWICFNSGKNAKKESGIANIEKRIETEQPTFIQESITADLEKRIQAAEEVLLVKKKIVKNKKVPYEIDDYSISSDKSWIVYSQLVNENKSGRFPYQNGEHFRLFLWDFKSENCVDLMDKLNMNLPAFDSIKREHYNSVLYKDLVAPIISPDGNRIAFATPAFYCVPALYVINSNGTNLKSITGNYTTLNFGWVSSDSIFVWAVQGEINADIGRKKPYPKQETFISVLDNYNNPNNTLNKLDSPVDVLDYVETRQLKIKTISNKKIGYYVLSEY